MQQRFKFSDNRSSVIVENLPLLILNSAITLKEIIRKGKLGYQGSGKRKELLKKGNNEKRN